MRVYKKSYKPPRNKNAPRRKRGPTRAGSRGGVGKATFIRRKR